MDGLRSSFSSLGPKWMAKKRRRNASRADKRDQLRKADRKKVEEDNRSEMNGKRNCTSDGTLDGRSGKTSVLPGALDEHLDEPLDATLDDALDDASGNGSAASSSDALGERLAWKASNVKIGLTW